nr:unnamed protein product [Callosobruchus chinensis]
MAQVLHRSGKVIIIVCTHTVS